MGSEKNGVSRHPGSSRGVAHARAVGQSFSAACAPPWRARSVAGVAGVAAPFSRVLARVRVACGSPGGDRGREGGLGALRAVWHLQDRSLAKHLGPIPAEGCRSGTALLSQSGTNPSLVQKGSP